MKWVMIIALWNTDVPQDSFRFFTQIHNSKDDCELVVQVMYIASKERNIQAQGVCVSEIQLGLIGKTI